METKKTPVEKLKEWAFINGFTNGKLQIIISELEAAELYAGQTKQENEKIDIVLLSTAKKLGVDVDFSDKSYDGDLQCPIDRYSFIEYLCENFNGKQSSPVSLEVEENKTAEDSNDLTEKIIKAAEVYEPLPSHAPFGLKMPFVDGAKFVKDLLEPELTQQQSANAELKKQKEELTEALKLMIKRFEGIVGYGEPKDRNALNAAYKALGTSKHTT